MRFFNVYALICYNGSAKPIQKKDYFTDFLILFENTSNIMYYIFMDNYIAFIAHNDIAWLYN